MSVTVPQFSRDSQRMSRRVSGEFERKCDHGAVSGVASWTTIDSLAKLDRASPTRASQEIKVESEGVPARG